MADGRSTGVRAATATMPDQLLQLATLHEAVTDAQTYDLGLVDDASLDGVLAELVMARDRLSVVMSTVLAEWNGRGAWARDGSRSPAHRLARLTSRSVRSCQDDLVRARRLELLPTGQQAVIDGDMSLDVLDLLVHVATPTRQPFLVEHEAELVGAIREMPYPAARTAVRYWAERADDQRTVDAYGADAVGGRVDETRMLADVDRVVEHGERGPAPGVEAEFGPGSDSDVRRDPSSVSKVFLSTTLDDMVVLDGTFDAISGTIVSNELSRLVGLLTASDRAAGIRRTAAQRRAAALVEMATRSATAPEGGRRPRPLFTVLIGASSFDHLCELSNGRVLSPSKVLPYLDQAVIESVLFDGPSTVISVSARRRFTGALRRAIEVRDRHCQHTGTDCDVPAEQCDVDHIVPYSQGGETSQFNGRIECSPHNQQPDLHDHGVEPLRERTVDRLDELRCRLRWRIERTTIDGGDRFDRDDGFDRSGWFDGHDELRRRRRV